MYYRFGLAQIFEFKCHTEEALIGLMRRALRHPDLGMDPETIMWTMTPSITSPVTPKAMSAAP